MVLFFGLFAAVLVVTFLFVGLGMAFLRSTQNNKIRTMLRTADPVIAERSVELLRPSSVENSLARLLATAGFGNKLDLWVSQSGLEWTAGKLILVCIGSFLLGLMLVLQLKIPFYKSAAVAACSVSAGILPLLIVMKKRAKRMAAFEEQLPDALDFLSRSLRAGHAFSIGLEMLVLDSPDPLGSIFRRALNDLHLGSPLEVALGKILSLAPLVDVRFFIASVLLQQETGGNLSEILSKLSHVNRERFRLRGQVKAASAHGRITGLVLVLMPVGVGVLLMMTSPAYLAVLFKNSLGQDMVVGAIVAQILGFFFIRKIVNIKV